MKHVLLALVFVLIFAHVAPAADRPEDGKTLEALIEKGNAQLQAGEIPAACSTFEKAVELSEGRSYEAQLGLASARIHANDPGGALASAQAADKLSANDAMHSAAAFLVGLALYQSRPTDAAALAQAATALETAVQLAGDQPSPRVTLGFVYLGLGQPEKAITQLREALTRLAPLSPMRQQVRVGICGIRKDHPELALARSETPSHVNPSAGVQKPVKVYAPDPQYTIEARTVKIQGVVIVQAIIDREGCITDIKVLKGLGGGLVESVQRTLQYWVFEPAILDQKPIDVYYNITINFRLDPNYTVP